MRAALLLALALSGGALACDDSHAGLEITDARATRGPDKRVIVDVDVYAHEALGGNLGTYCTRAIFGPEAPVEECMADLEDGDTKTFRFVSKGDIAPGANINVRIRHAAVDIGRNIAAPSRD